MTNTKVISVLAIVAVAAMMGVASIAPAYAMLDFAKNAVAAPFVDRAGSLDITGTCIANVDRDGNLHLRMIGHGFNSGQKVFFGTQPGGGIDFGFANDLGDVNSGDLVLNGFGSTIFDCRIGIQGNQEASADIDISA